MDASREASISAAQVVNMLEDLYNRGDAGALRELVDPNVRHYSSAISDGAEAWVEFASRFQGKTPLLAVHRTVEEGRRIGLHAHYAWNAERVLDGGPGVAVAHVFTVDGGRITEAIEVTQPVAIETVSGNDMFSQVAESVLDQDIDRNRQTATRVVTEFLAGQTDLAAELLSDYTQHNPNIPNGAGGIAGFIDAMGGSPSEFKFAMAERDFALTFQRYAANTRIGTPAFTAVDLWRFDADGKVTEHWDVLEPAFVSPSGTDPFARGAWAAREDD